MKGLPKDLLTGGQTLSPNKQEEAQTPENVFSAHPTVHYDLWDIQPFWREDYDGLFQCSDCQHHAWGTSSLCAWSPEHPPSK